MTDPISDMLTRIRNASVIKKPEVVLPMSKIKYEIAKILEKEGWIKKAEVMKDSLLTKHSSFEQLKLTLKYNKNGKSHISALKRVSKPGLRVYVASTELPIVLNNLGIAIISTSKGLMTNAEAKERKIGGEVICEIY